MILGHALVAFAVVGAAAGRRVDSRSAVTLAVVAATFAVVPDVDVLFALPGLIEGIGELFAVVNSGKFGPEDVFTVTGSFWGASTEVHRAVTHSLVVSAPVAVAAGLLCTRHRTAAWPLESVGAGLLLLTPVALAVAVGGRVEVAMLATLGIAVALLARVVRRRTDLKGRTVGVLAAVGLGTHPFGDLFTGTPPRLLYPLDVDPFPTRVLISADPTLHLLGTFGLELLAAWAALSVGLGLYGQSAVARVRPVALVGATYGLLGVVLVPPTLSTSYHFVFSVVAVGLLGAAAVVVGAARRTPSTDTTETATQAEGSHASAGSPTRDWTRRRHRAASTGETLRFGGVAVSADTAATALVTGTAAVTFAWAAYLAVYLVAVASS